MLLVLQASQASAWSCIWGEQTALSQPCRLIEPVVRGDSGYRESEEQVSLGPRAIVVVGIGCLKFMGQTTLGSLSGW